MLLEPHTRRDFIGFGLFAAAIAPANLAAQDADAMTILTVVAPDGITTTFSDHQLSEVPWVKISTHTAWTDGPQEFTGPLLRDVLSLTGISMAELMKRTLRISALNDFAITIPASDGWEYDPILARTRDGRKMPVRSKGPLWLVYPRDDRDELRTPGFDERWIWQIWKIEIF